ncbi:hypothetical protein [Phaffia rhodozyma]|uniref:Uncharacterized protein n=1 Tax=Phaffia rhodozyma TaxID=264483 RepID=A0A0F7SMG2_PHARH|nr:hypothetical protein [Phaffia rhodozyma]
MSNLTADAPATKPVTNSSVEQPAETKKVVPSANKQPTDHNIADDYAKGNFGKEQKPDQKVGSVDGIVDHGMVGKEVGDH